MSETFDIPEHILQRETVKMNTEYKTWQDVPLDWRPENHKVSWFLHFELVMGMPRLDEFDLEEGKRSCRQFPTKELAEGYRDYLRNEQVALGRKEMAEKIQRQFETGKKKRSIATPKSDSAPAASPSHV